MKQNKEFIMTRFFIKYTLVLGLVLAGFTMANFSIASDPNLDVDSPAIAAIKTSMTTRHAELLPHYVSGAVGLTQDGFIALKDATALPLKDRGGINNIVSAENADRIRLYKEIAAGNGHPEWEGDIRQTFAGRWIEKAQAGWHYQNSGAWVKK